MLNIAIIDDEQKEIDTLTGFIREYENGANSFNIYSFGNPIDLFSSSKVFDIVFLDIEMPLMNGMDAAKKLRENNNECIIIFVTRMSQFAVEGYAVDALDFLVKPLNYDHFAMRFKKAEERALRSQTQTIIIKNNDLKIRIQLNDLIYVESIGHQLVWHTVKEQYSTWDTLSNIYAQLSLSSFAHCNRGQIVNLKFVKRIQKNDIYLYNTETVLQLSRSAKQQFVDKMTLYL